MKNNSIRLISLQKSGQPDFIFSSFDELSILEFFQADKSKVWMLPDYDKLDARAKRTFDTLLRKVLDLLQKEDIAQITITRLCRETHVSRSTIYRYFNSASEILEYFEAQVFANCVKPIDEFHIKHNLPLIQREIALKIIKRLCEKRSEDSNQ